MRNPPPSHSSSSPPRSPGRKRRVRRRRKRRRYRRLRLILLGIILGLMAIAIHWISIWVVAFYYSSQAWLQGDLVWIQARMLRQKDYKETKALIQSLESPGIIALKQASQSPGLTWCDEDPQQCLKRLKRRFPLVYQELKASGLDPAHDPYAVISGLDLLQIASSSSSRLFSRQYADIKANEDSTQQALVSARVYAVLNGNPLDTPDLGANCPPSQSDRDCLYTQQRQRVRAIAQVLQPHLQASFIIPAQGTLSQGFNTAHQGIDIANSPGTPILASASGTVLFAGWDEGGLGNLVRIHHADGSIAVYGHNQKVLVNAGDRVEQGQIIAEMGNSGNSTGPHLHFELHLQGQATNPLALLSDVESIAKH
ncbi:M23 family metallopeptidase [Spirulina sp. CS-785/01]|uniref:M23 family metallopeptidase n=1 Tax=Spirulina sp. CS-785/01 TaxID=3021716 RepID=UPI00232B978F|nr:M23 family metallopeptidase [Spirulina sp. CS-785/01]MDB9312333.1 M23 family metallopeptidase [Spirulina sp. CS-785/01]